MTFAKRIFVPASSTRSGQDCAHTHRCNFASMQLLHWSTQEEEQPSSTDLPKFTGNNPYIASVPGSHHLKLKRLHLLLWWHTHLSTECVPHLWSRYLNTCSLISQSSLSRHLFKCSAQVFSLRGTNCTFILVLMISTALLICMDILCSSDILVIREIHYTFIAYNIT